MIKMTKAGDFVVWKHEYDQKFVSCSDITISEVLVCSREGGRRTFKIPKVGRRSRLYEGEVLFSSGSRTECEKIAARCLERRHLYDELITIFSQGRSTPFKWRLPGFEETDGDHLDKGTVLYRATSVPIGEQNAREYSIAHFERKSRYRLTLEKNPWSRRIKLFNTNALQYSSQRLPIEAAIQAFDSQVARLREGEKLIGHLETAVMSQLRDEEWHIFRGGVIEIGSYVPSRSDERTIDLERAANFIRGPIYLDQDLPAISTLHVSPER